MTKSIQKSRGGNGVFTFLFSILDFHIIATPIPVIRRFSENKNCTQERSKELENSSRVKLFEHTFEETFWCFFPSLELEESRVEFLLIGRYLGWDIDHIVDDEVSLRSLPIETSESFIRKLHDIVSLCSFLYLESFLPDDRDLDILAPSESRLGWRNAHAIVESITIALESTFTIWH